MYYAITETKVYSAKTLALLNRSMNGLMDEDEFKQIGGDCVALLSPSDLDFVQDKRKLSTIMFGNFFKKDTLPRNLMILNIILTFIMFIRIGG
jgi:hypothetical protein